MYSSTHIFLVLVSNLAGERPAKHYELWLKPYDARSARLKNGQAKFQCFTTPWDGCNLEMLFHRDWAFDNKNVHWNLTEIQKKPNNK